MSWYLDTDIAIVIAVKVFKGHWISNLVKEKNNISYILLVSRYLPPKEPDSITISLEQIFLNIMLWIWDDFSNGQIYQTKFSII